MPRLGRGTPIRPHLLRQPYRLDQTIGLGPFETEAEFPALTVTTPDARIHLGPFETEAEFPALSLSYDQTIGLGPFETEAEFPALTVSVPILPGANIDRPGQIEWNGFLLGSGTPYRWRELGGWKKRPPITSGNVARSSGHGSYAGRPTMQERIITWAFRIRAPRTDMEQVVEDLEDVTGLPEDETPLPLVIRELDTPYLVYAQLGDRDPGPVDKTYRLGMASQAVLQWTCPDPRRYGLILHGVTIPLGVPTQLLNAGNTSTHPLIRIPGPAVTPQLANLTLGRIISFNLTLADGEVLEIDTFRASARVGDTNVMGHLGGSVPVPDFVLGRGQGDRILYTTASGGDRGADFLWRDART